MKVYDITYDPVLEGDVQDNFIASMSKRIFSGKLHVKDEKGRCFTIDPGTRAVYQKL
ncbi:MAG: hypothetical protein RBT69_06000 [Spirochaetia bacterium]|nr:hypothetical protein [Spirochaetia bacterium]